MAETKSDIPNDFGAKAFLLDLFRHGYAIQIENLDDKVTKLFHATATRGDYDPIFFALGDYLTKDYIVALKNGFFRGVKGTFPSEICGKTNPEDITATLYEDEQIKLYNMTLDNEKFSFNVAILDYKNSVKNILNNPSAKTFRYLLDYVAIFTRPHNLGVEYSLHNDLYATICFALHENLIIYTKDRTFRSLEGQENPILPDGSFSYEGINGRLLADKEVRQLVRKPLPNNIELIGVTVNTPDGQVGLYTPYILPLIMKRLYITMTHKSKWLDLTKIFPFPSPI